MNTPTDPYETSDQFLARFNAHRDQLLADVTYFLAVPPPARMPTLKSRTLLHLAMSIPA
jgi:hypothetical protein